MSNNPFKTPTQTPKKQSGSTDQLVEVLTKTRPWVRFLSVLAFIGGIAAILVALLVLIVGMLSASTGGLAAGPQGAGGGIAVAIVSGVLYLLLAFIYLVPASHLWKYAEGINKFSEKRSTANLLTAMEAQQKFWRFAGGIMLAYIVIMVSVLVIFLLFGILFTGFSR